MSATILVFPRAPLAFHVALKAGLSRSEAHALERAKRAAKTHLSQPAPNHHPTGPNGPKDAA